MNNFDAWFNLTYFTLLEILAVSTTVYAHKYKIPGVRWVLTGVTLFVSAIVFLQAYSIALPPFADPFWCDWFK